MSSFFIVPVFFWDCPVKTLACPDTSSGSIYNAINSPANDILEIDGGGNINIESNAAAGFVPVTSLSSSNSAIYMKLADDVLDDPDTDCFGANFYTGANSGALTQRTLSAVYGDCKANGDTVDMNDAAPSAYQIDGFANVIGAYDDQYTGAYQRIGITATAGVPVSTPTVYEFMIGHIVSAPDGFIRRDRQEDIMHFGGRVGTTRFGNSTWSGVYSNRPRKHFELVMQALRVDTRNQMRDMFRYGRGCYPILFVEDSDDVRTWKKIKILSKQEVENSGEFDVTLEVEEI
jgi:hypothetical protein